MLASKGYDIMDDDEDYKYLTRMPMDSVTEENVSKLEKERGTKEADLQRVHSMSIQQMWLLELDELVEEYGKFKEEKQRLNSSSGLEKKEKKVKKVAKLSIV